MTGIKYRVAVEMTTYQREYLIDLIGEKIAEAQERVTSPGDSSARLAMLEDLMTQIESAVGP